MRKSPKPIFENSHYLALLFKIHCMNTEEKLKGIQAVLGAPEVRTDNEGESEEEVIALFARAEQRLGTEGGISPEDFTAWLHTLRQRQKP